MLRTREFLQIAGRAGRAGYDTAGYVVVQAPEHVIENEKAKAKAAAKNTAMSAEKQAKRGSKAQLKKPPAGTVVWTEQTFDKLVEGRPEPLKSQMKVDNSMLVNVLSREEDAFPVLRRLLMDNHEDRRTQLRLAKRAVRLARSLVTSEVLTRLDEVDGFGRRYVLTEALPEDFALNQPLSHFALAVLDVLDPDDPAFMLDVVSVVEATLEAPRPLLLAQRHAARGEAIAALKADGVEYDERMALIEDVTWPEPLGDLLEPLFETYRERHPWLAPDALAPKSVVREMWEQGMGVHRPGLPLPGGPLRGAGAALPHRRLPRPAADRPGVVPDRGAGAAGRVAGGDRPSGRLLACSTSGRRSPTPTTPRPAVSHHAPPPPAAAAQPAGAGLRRDGPQRAVAPGRARRPRRRPGARRARAGGLRDEPGPLGRGDRGVLRGA